MLELLGSTARDKVEPMRWLPSAGPLTHGIETPVTTRMPAMPSPGSTNAVNGLLPTPQVSSRTTTTSIVANEPFQLVQRRNAVYTVPSDAAAGRTDGQS